MSIRLLILIAFISPLHVVPTLGKMKLKSSFSYLTFVSSLSNNTSPIVFDGTQMNILAKDFSESEKYVYLQRELDPYINPDDVSYLKRNYNPKTPLLLQGFTAHGYATIDRELRYVVATDPATNDLYVLTLGIKSIPSIPSNVDYQYYILEKKKVPKNSKLLPDVIVKSAEAARTSSSITYGKRIFICGTTVTNKLFFAIYNTVYNLTEYSYEDSASNDNFVEYCKDIHIDTNSGHFLIITQRLNFKTENEVTDITIKIRRMAMDWEKEIENITTSEPFETYKSSCLISGLLIIACHSKIYTSKFRTFWAETGIHVGNAQESNIFHQTEFYNILSIAAADDNTIYAFTEIHTTKSGLPDSYAIMLINLEITMDTFGPKINFKKIDTKVIFPDSSMDEETIESFTKYKPTQLFLHYPMRIQENNFPAVLLLGHKGEGENVGILMYGFVTDNEDYGYNPFAVKSVDNHANECKFSVGSESSIYCLACSDTNTNKFLYNFKCHNECPSGTYEDSSNICRRCHLTCAKCTRGPLRNHCDECISGMSYNSFLGQCFSTNNNTAHRYHYNLEREAVPIYGFDLGEDYQDSFEFAQSGISSDALCVLKNVKLSIPDDLLTIPDEFTLGFWFIDDGLNLSGLCSAPLILSAFGNFDIKPISSSKKIQFIIKNGNTEITQELNTQWGKKWKYISLSVKNTLLSHTITMYVYTNELSEGEIYTERGNAPLIYRTFVKSIILGSNVENCITGAFKDLVLIPKYFNKEDMEISKSLLYHNKLQVYTNLLSYWRFRACSNYKDEITGMDPICSGGSDFLPRETDYFNTLKIARTCQSKWGIVGTFFDLFSYSKFPAFSFDTLNFGPNELEPKINLNTFSVLSGIIKKGDKLIYSKTGCSEDSENILGTAEITFSLNKVKIKQDKGFTSNVRGKFVNTCYCTKISEDPVEYKCIQLGRTYFPLLPTQIYPAHGKSDTESSPVKFELRGGDQSYGDKLTMVNMNKDVVATTKETIIVDEKDNGYSVYSAVRWTDGEYNKIAVAGLDPGVYTIGWRPSYMSYLADERNVIYKNLFNTWTIQSPPKVRFPPLEGVPDVFKNTVVYKGEYYYLDLVGEGQADGDQVIFCHTGCSYQNNMSRPIQRENGRYPPIWIGEEGTDEPPNYGIWGIAKKGPLAEKLFICWRPASRALHINPNDDKWDSLENFHNPKRAYIIINNVVSEKPEIVSISLNMGDSNSTNRHYPVITPVLYQGDTLWFKFGSPCATYAENGKIEISHVIYDSYKRDSYTLGPVWVQELLSEYKTSDSWGKIKHDKAMCNYTLQEIPYSKMKPGHDYMLIIYSRTFKTDRYFGSEDSNIAQFKYLFRYQEATFVEDNIQILVPNDNKLTIKGTNFGNFFIPGNGFVESRKLFSVAVELKADPPCGNTNIRASYIPEHLEEDPVDIVLRDVDLSTCTSSNVISVHLKLIKIADDFTEYPLWSTTNSSQLLQVAKVGCDPTCKTCSGPTTFDCITCDIDSEYPYLYKSRCLAKCESDFPYTEIIYIENSYNYAYYKCVDECKPGQYLDKKYGVCLECSYQCGTCSSGKPKSCNKCKGAYVNVNNQKNDLNEYKETFYFNGMCLLSCPVIRKDDEDPASNIIKTNMYEHKCEEINDPENTPKMINVTIQQVIYKEKLNIKKPTSLRALLTDLRDFKPNETTALNANYIWNAYPEEDTQAKNFYSSDKRSFQNYTKENLHRAITSLNMNSFNYKSESDQMRIIVRAWANGYFDYDMTELFGNRPPELEDENVKVRYKGGSEDLTSSNELKTNITLVVHLKDVQDADDNYPKLRFKVLLVPRSLVLPSLENVITPESALLLLAQLPEQYMILYSNKQVEPNSDGTITLDDIYIPPLINGHQVISKSEKLTSNKVSCDLFVYVEDRHLGVTKSKFIFNILEVHDPDTMDETINHLTEKMRAKNNKKAIGWDDVLQIAHTLRAVNPEHTLYYMSYNFCTRDDQCNNGGKCVTSGGWSKCNCAKGFTGVICNWEINQYISEQEVIEYAMDFLNATVLGPVSKQASYKIEDTNMIDQLANVLIGLLKNPEVIPNKYYRCIVELTNYMTQTDYLTGGRLEDFERNNVFSAFDAVIKYVSYYTRQHIYEFYLLGEYEDSFNDRQIVEYNEMRASYSDTILMIRNALYRFADAISLVQYPLRSPYSIDYDTFELFLSAEMEKSMFNSLGDSLAIQMRSEQDYIHIPSSLFETVRKEVSINEEFKIRIIKWKENPYVFSDFHSEVCTSVFNFALMNSDSKLLDVEMNDPVVIFTPIFKSIKNLDSDAVRCMNFNSEKTIQSKVRERVKINVNKLEYTDEEKKVLFPEWNAEYYQSKNLIVEQDRYKTIAVKHPEFENARGFSSYGNILDPREYLDKVSCAVYGAGEVAGVAERKRSRGRGFPPIDFYYEFNVMDDLYFNIGMYTCIVVGVMMIISMIGSYMLDLMLLPKHDKLIRLHRLQRESDKTGGADGDSSITVNSESNEMSDRREENVKINIDSGLDDRPKRRTTKHHGKRMLTKKRGYKKRVSVNNTSKSGNTQSKEMTTEDKLTYSNATSSIINQSHTRIELKDTDNNTTTQHHTTTQDPVGSTGNWSTSEPQKTNSEEHDLKLHSSIQSDEIHKRPKEDDQRIENIFSKEHIAKRERQEFEFLNNFIASNLLLNLITRNNNIYTRPERCFVMFNYIYIMLFCCAVFISTVAQSLSNPEVNKATAFLTNRHVWIIFISPIFASILLFLVAGVFKVDEKRIQEAHIVSCYKNIMYITYLTLELNISRRLECVAYSVLFSYLFVFTVLTSISVASPSNMGIYFN